MTATTTTQFGRLGEGIWIAEDVIGPEDSFHGGHGIGPIEETKGCAHCGNTRLKWRVVLRNKVTGKAYFVGLTCAKRAGGDVLDLKTAQEKAEDRSIRARLDDPEFAAWAKAQPHPKGWTRNGASLYTDLVFWTRRANKRKLTPLNQAWDAYTAEKTGKPAPVRKPTKRELARLEVLNGFAAKIGEAKALAFRLGYESKRASFAEGRPGVEFTLKPVDVDPTAPAGWDWDCDYLMERADRIAERALYEANKARKGLRGNPPEGYLAAMKGGSSAVMRSVHEAFKAGQGAARAEWRVVLKLVKLVTTEAMRAERAEKIRTSLDKYKTQLANLDLSKEAFMAPIYANLIEKLTQELATLAA